MITKDLAYSIEQVRDFLSQMDNVLHNEENLYRYKNAEISLSEKKFNHESDMPVTKFALPRSCMNLSGNTEDINEFYKSFMINHMTMGG